MSGFIGVVVGLKSEEKAVREALDRLSEADQARVRIAVSGADAARAEAHARAFAEAGADCLFAPGLRTPEQVSQVVEAVAPKPVNVLATIDKVRKQGVGVVFITHNVRHALAVGDRFTVLNRGKTLGTAMKGEITPEELQDMMAGGQELATLEGSLGGTV